MPEIMNPPRQIDVVKAIVAYATRAAVAGLLMMWGTMNLVHNLVAFSRGPAQQHWWIAMFFILLTAVLPLAVGVRLSLKLFRDNNRKG